MDLATGLIVLWLIVAAAWVAVEYTQRDAG